MKLGENGGRMTMLSGVLAAGLTAIPEESQAQDFNSYCEPLANGEVLESELTPQNMSYIFDENGRVIGTRADELTQHFGDGISEACDTGDVGAYVSQIGDRILLEIYPPGQYPLGIDPATFQEIQANYQACIGEELAAVDDNGNGRIDAGEDVTFYREGEEFCNERLQSAMQHEGRIAALNAEQRAASDRISDADARISDARARAAALTESLIAGAREEVGL